MVEGRSHSLITRKGLVRRSAITVVRLAAGRVKLRSHGNEGGIFYTREEVSRREPGLHSIRKVMVAAEGLEPTTLRI